MLLNDIIAELSSRADCANICYFLLGLEPATLAYINQKPPTWEFSPECQHCQNISTCGSYIWKVELFPGRRSKENSQTRK